jgi:acetyl-CoA synthetase
LDWNPHIIDVINVSGHRLSTAEIESALIQHPGVAETAVIGATDDLTGQAVHAFVTLKPYVSFLFPFIDVWNLTRLL